MSTGVFHMAELLEIIIQESLEIFSKYEPESLDII